MIPDINTHEIPSHQSPTTNNFFSSAGMGSKFLKQWQRYFIEKQQHRHSSSSFPFKTWRYSFSLSLSRFSYLSFTFSGQTGLCRLCIAASQPKVTTKTRRETHPWWINSVSWSFDLSVTLQWGSGMKVKLHERSIDGSSTTSHISSLSSSCTVADLLNPRCTCESHNT